MYTTNEGIWERLVKKKKSTSIFVGEWVCKKAASLDYFTCGPKIHLSNKNLSFQFFWSPLFVSLVNINRNQQSDEAEQQTNHFFIHKTCF